MRWLSLGLALAVSGCIPDLGPWYVELPTVPGTDGGTVQPGRDSGRPPVTGGPCALPHLLVAAENLSGGAGRILRFELPTEGGLRACGPLTAQGELMQQPFSIAAVTDRFVLAAGREGVQAIDPSTDALLYTLARSGQHPNDAFALRDDSRGDWVGGVAWSNLGSSSGIRGGIRDVVAYTVEGAERWRWDGSALGISSSTAVSSAPDDFGELVVTHPTNWAAARLDPFAQILRTSPPLVGPIGGTVLGSVGAGSGVGVRMIAWTGRVDGEPRVLTLEEPYTDDITQVTCGDEGCEFEHAAIDPSRRRAVIALCGLDGVRRSVVRLDFTAMVCEPLLPADSAPSGMRLSYLAFAQAR